MAKVLVIPDIHLKPYIFDYANVIMKKFKLTQAVFIGDLVDDWDKENDIDLYKNTINRAIRFKKQYPDSLYCWGNHEAGYFTDCWSCSGNSKLYRRDIRLLLQKYENEVQPQYIHYIDDCLFSHAGLSKDIMSYIESSNDNITASYIAELFNDTAFDDIGEYNSLLWLRPGFGTEYYSKYVQVVGHTPVTSIQNSDNVWFVDTFSTYSNGLNYGNNEFMIIDTITYTVDCVQVTDDKVITTKTLTGRSTWSNKID